ncbi:hypothetical protein [Marinobacter sp. OP 3.4]|uniref:hypothetical protein n=1 Tax=Marinobacter sp. OP 3.4 TaxID=3076501 RepID=UPI002E1FCCF6
MHRIDGPGATNDNKFTEGDPAAGTRATIVTPEWLNSVQEELARVIEDAGLTLSKESSSQLLQALDVTNRPFSYKSIAEDLSGKPIKNGRAYSFSEFKQGSGIGGGDFIGDTSLAKSGHGLFGWSPTVPPISAQPGETYQEKRDNYLNGLGETDPGGTGLFVRQSRVATPEQYGADGVLDDTLPWQMALAYSNRHVFGKYGATYNISDKLDITSWKNVDLNGSALSFELDTTSPGFNVQSNNVDIHNGSITVVGSVMGGYGGSLNCIYSGNQSTGEGYKNLHYHDLTVSTNRDDAGAHIGVIGECRNFEIYNITVPDNQVCRNIIGIEWGGTPGGGTGHPHNGKIYNIKIGAISTPTTDFAYAVWCSGAFNINIQNITMEQGFGLLMATRGDNANTYAPARYKALVGTGITFENLSINACYGYGIRVVGSHRSETLDPVPMSVKGRGLRVVGQKLNGNNNFGMSFEQCRDVHISGIDISGDTAGGSFCGTAVDGLLLEDGEIVDADLYGALLGSDSVLSRRCRIRNITFKRNNANGGGLTSTAAVSIRASEDCSVEDCVFGEEGETETQKYSIAIASNAARVRLQNNHTHALAASGVAYHNPSSTDASGINNTAAEGLTLTTGTWQTPVFTGA